MKQTSKNILISGFILCAVLAMVGIVFVWICGILYATTSIPNLISYTFQILGVLASFAVVVVAIFSQDIKTWMYGEQCLVELNANVFTEQLGDTQSIESPQAQYYEAIIKITNTGRVEIRDCMLYLRSLEFQQYGAPNSKPRSLTLDKDPIVLWRYPYQRSANLVMGDNHLYSILRILPNNNVQTPDNKKNISKRVRIFGCRALDGYDQKGIWTASYCVKSSTKIVATFTVKAEWDGSWKSRQNEMQNVTSLSLTQNIKI